jgi:CelD/BcsL family acetyltransferase involved in cellulose biosynthesis
MEQYSFQPPRIGDTKSPCRGSWRNALNNPMSGRFSIALSEISSLKDLEPEWRLLDQSNGGSFFTSWPWIGTWLSVLPPSVTPNLLQFQYDGQFCGAAIAVRRDVRRFGFSKIRQIHLNETGDPQLDCLTIEHNGFAGRAPDDIDAWQALLDWFGSGAADADELSVSGVTRDIKSVYLGKSLLPGNREIAAYQVNLAEIRASGGSVGSILSANSRQQLNRSMRVITAMGTVKFAAAKTVEEALTFFERLKCLHIQSWTRRGQPHGFIYPFVERFHRELISYCLPRGHVELLRLSAGSHELGYLYNFRQNGMVYAYQSGFNDEDRRLRPGYVAHALAIERSAASGADCYDFMAGTNRLKQSFANSHYAMRWYKLQRPLWRFRVEQVARTAKRHLSPFANSF